jgi:predicted RND superfamily exporter protein
LKLADWVLRHRVTILLAFGGLSLAGGWAASRLEFNFSFWTLFVSDDPEVVHQVRYTDQWGEDAALMFVALRSGRGNVITPENLALVDEIERRAAEVGGIDETTSIVSVTSVRGEGDEIFVGKLADDLPSTPEETARFEALARGDRLVLGTLLSENLRTTLVALRIEDGLRDAKQRNPIVRAVQAIATEVTAGTDLSADVTGIPTAQYAYSEKMANDLLVFVIVSTILLGFCLLLMFRSAAGVVLPLFVIGIATVTTMGVVELVGGHINMINVALPTLLLVIGIADGVHLYEHYNQTLIAGAETRDAIKATFVKLGWACVLTSVTTAVGFLSLASARIATVRSFGLFAAIGIGFAFLGNILLVPIGLSIFEPRARPMRNAGNGMMVGLLETLGHLTVRHPWRTLAIAAPIVVGTAVGARDVVVGSRLFEEISDDDPIVQAHRRLEEDLPGVSSYALDVSTDPGEATSPETLRALDALAQVAMDHPSVDKAMGLADVIKEMNRAAHGGDPAEARIPDSSALIAQYLLLAEGDLTDRLVNADHSRTQVWMRGPETVTTVWEELRAELEQRAQELLPDAEVLVTGSSSMGKRALGQIIDDIMTSLMAATVVILLVMSLLFRSLRIGLLSMVPNLIPLAMTIGVMGYAGIMLRTSTVIIFSVSLGLAVDDTIHFLVRYRRERAAGRRIEDAVVETMRTTGRPIVYTSLLLIGGFWVLILSSFHATRDVGLLGGVTLLSALMADLIVLPALLRVFARARLL